MTTIESTVILAQNATMTTIPAGILVMGAEGWGEYEQPIHEVWIDAFLMDTTAVTNQQFAEFVAATGYITTAEQHGIAMGYKEGVQQEIKGLSWKSYHNMERNNHPVVLVSWEDANAFATWAGKRLPTEAEFEWAGRGGLQQNLYAWGNDEPTEKDCNFGKITVEAPPTTPVGSFMPNGYGLYDMCGNVWNWCNDWFGENYYANSESHNPQGPENGKTKVRRGASFNIIQPFRLRCSNRGAYLPDSYAINIGFRCVRNII